MSERCKESVHDGGRSVTFHRCRKYAVSDGYCKQHSPEATKARREKAVKRFEERMEKSDWRQLQLARERISLLEERLDEEQLTTTRLSGQNFNLNVDNRKLLVRNALLEKVAEAAIGIYRITERDTVFHNELRDALRAVGYPQEQYNAKD